MSRNNFQIFTPPAIAEDLLDIIGYTSNLFGRRILENSCGDRHILAIIVDRYINDCLSKKMDRRIIKRGLATDITAYETDDNLREQCRTKIDSIATKYRIKNVKWRLLETDYLTIEHTPQYSFIAGNPPYISYGVLAKDNRKLVKDNYITCKSGRCDYCYAFIEASINNLLQNGKMAYIVPSSIFKTQYAGDLRNFMLPHLSEVSDYTSDKIFEGVLTSSAVISLTKNQNANQFTYNNIKNQTSIVLAKNTLQEKWKFETCELTQNGRRFGDYYHVATAIATQANKVFVLSQYRDEGDSIVVGDIPIEKQILRRAFSPKHMAKGRVEYIIFPYTYSEDAIQHYTEIDFCRLYPQAVRYLKSQQKTLEKRDADKSALWFEYGRSQALTHLNQPKLMLSTVFTERMRVYPLQRDDIPYSGLYVVPRRELSLQVAQTILESQAFTNYIKTCGIHVNGSSMRFVARDIQNYLFE
jgi:adenine-specific DNA methylase